MATFRTDVIRYLTDRPGQVVYRSDIAADVGIDVNQVQQCIYNLIKNRPIGNEIEVVVAGNAWRYVPRAVTTSPETTDQPVNGATRSVPATTTVPVNVAARRSTSTVVNRVFEEIGESQDGTIIIQESETGALYRATLI